MYLQKLSNVKWGKQPINLDSLFMKIHFFGKIDQIDENAVMEWKRIHQLDKTKIYQLTANKTHQLHENEICQWHADNSHQLE